MLHRLNLASGTDIRDGWINLDVVKQWPGTRRGCDNVWDARSGVIPFPDESVSEVYAGYLFLHLAPYYHDKMMSEIRRVTVKDALLRVSEVDMPVVVARWLKDPDDWRAAELIWGEQGCNQNQATHFLPFAEFDKHCCGFSEFTLRRLMTKHGFCRISRTTVHPGAYYELTLDGYRE